MNYEIAAQIILVCSLIGIGVIIFRKIPVLVKLPEVLPQKEESKLFLRLKEKIKILNPLKSFSYEIFLQKILSKVKILSLKAENKSSNWLKRLRMKAKIRKNLDPDYWEEIKKSIKNEASKRTK
jgi:hypothetical protein